MARGAATSPGLRAALARAARPARRRRVAAKRSPKRR
jgi:hypothetical protein